MGYFKTYSSASLAKPQVLSASLEVGGVVTIFLCCRGLRRFRGTTYYFSVCTPTTHELGPMSMSFWSFRVPIPCWRCHDVCVVLVIPGAAMPLLSLLTYAVASFTRCRPCLGWWLPSLCLHMLDQCKLFLILISYSGLIILVVTPRL